MNVVNALIFHITYVMLLGTHTLFDNYMKTVCQTLLHSCSKNYA